MLATVLEKVPGVGPFRAVGCGPCALKKGVQRYLFLLFALLLALYVLAGVKLRPPAAKPGGTPRSKMTRGEALLVLGLSEGASKQEIMAAYRNLVRKVHPDTQGGSAYLTSQINQARDVLLR